MNKVSVDFNVETGGSEITISLKGKFDYEGFESLIDELRDIQLTLKLMKESSNTERG